jgi:hypothetical protein
VWLGWPGRMGAVGCLGASPDPTPGLLPANLPGPPPAFLRHARARTTVCRPGRAPCTAQYDRGARRVGLMETDCNDLRLASEAAEAGEGGTDGGGEDNGWILGEGVGEDDGGEVTAAEPPAAKAKAGLAPPTGSGDEAATATAHKRLNKGHTREDGDGQREAAGGGEQVGGGWGLPCPALPCLGLTS